MHQIHVRNGPEFAEYFEFIEMEYERETGGWLCVGGLRLSQLKNYDAGSLMIG